METEVKEEVKEPKVEGTEVAPAATDADTKPETEELEDDPDYYSGSPVLAPASAVEDDFVKVPKAEYEALMSAAEKAKMLESDPVAQSILSWKQSGKPIEEFVQKGLVVNWKDMPPVEVYKHGLSDDLTEDERQDLIDSFLEKPPAVQKQEVSKLRKELDEAQSKKLLEINKQSQVAIEEQDRINRQVAEDFERSKSKWIAKGEIFGVPVDEAKFKEIAAWLTNMNTIFYNPQTKSVDVDRLIRVAAADLYARDIAKVAARKAVAKERQEVATLHQNARPPKTVAPSQPPPSTEVNNVERQRELDEYFKKQAQLRAEQQSKTY